jgi:glycine oxidase
MTAIKKIDFLIIGQGLAGSALAVELLLKRKEILVIDKPDSNVSSSIAAGLFNPVTGKMMAKTWLADKIFPSMTTFYTGLEKITGTCFFHSIPIYRPFLNAAEQNEWMGRSPDSLHSSYIKRIFTTSQYPDVVHDPFGGILLDQCGYVDTNRYVTAVRTWLQKNGCYREERFAGEKLMIDTWGLHYGDLEAAKIIFCEGDNVHRNRWFDWVPILPLKGELLTVRGKFLPDIIVNRGVYVVPTDEDGLWRIGATYDRDFKERGVTEAGRVELEAKLRAIVKIPFTVTGQTAGVRPATPDRRPVLGAHPLYSNLVIFNGLGTKGVSLSPYFADELVRWLENGEQLTKPVDISRYKSLYWNSR